MATHLIDRRGVFTIAAVCPMQLYSLYLDPRIEKVSTLLAHQTLSGFCLILACISPSSSSSSNGKWYRFEPKGSGSLYPSLTDHGAHVQLLCARVCFNSWKKRNSTQTPTQQIQPQVLTSDGFGAN